MRSVTGFGRCGSQRVRRRLHLARCVRSPSPRPASTAAATTRGCATSITNPSAGRDPAEPDRPAGGQPARPTGGGTGGGGGGTIVVVVSVTDLTTQAAWMAGLAIVVLLLAGWRKNARATAQIPRSEPTIRRKWVPIGVAETAAPLYKRPEHLPTHLGDRRQFGPGHRDRRRARHHHRVRTRLGRHHPHRPAEAVSRTRHRDVPKRATDAPSPPPGTPATSPSPNSGSRATTRPFGPPRSARSNGSARSATPASSPPSRTIRRWRSGDGQPRSPRSPRGRPARRTARRRPGGGGGGGLVVRRTRITPRRDRDAADRTRRRGQRMRSSVRRRSPRWERSATNAASTAIIAATSDKPAVRRRAVLALAPFEGPEVEAAIERALTDRDWQVRQAAEDLRRAAELNLVQVVHRCQAPMRDSVERVAVHVGVAGDEAEPQVEPVRRLPRRAAGEAHVLGASPSAPRPARPG